MGSKSGNNYDEELSNGESSSTKGNNTSMIVNVNSTHSDLENDSNYSRSDQEESQEQDNSSDSKTKDSSSPKSRRDSSKKSPGKDSKNRSKVDTSTRYLWVSNIPPGTKTNQLEEVFNEYGKVLAIKIIRGSGNSLLGFVKLETVEQAQRCTEKLNKSEFRGNKIEIHKERPFEKDDKKSEKIGFRDSRKYLLKPPMHISMKRQAPLVFRPSRGSYRGSSKTFSSRIPPRVNTHEIRRQEREEVLRLERERQKVKLERLKLEREKAELLKMEREGRYESHHPRERVHEEKRIRSMVKRPFDDSYLEEKRYDDFNRREEFHVHRGFSGRSSPERKINPRSFGSISSGRGRYEESSRSDHHRYSDSKYESGKSWQTMPSESSWLSSSSGDRWNSSTYDAPSSRIVTSSIGSNHQISRMHSSGPDISQGVSSRSYFNNRRY